VNSCSTHIGALQVIRKGMASLGAYSRQRSGSMRMGMTKLNMLTLQN
jgi:hypothetical protein